MEWLGKVPVHWGVMRLGRLITLTTGFPFKSEGFTQSEEDFRLLRGVNIAPGRLRWEEVVRWPVADAENFTEYQLELGDIVLGMDRPIIQDGIRVAEVGQSDLPSLLLQRVARIRPSEELDGDFALLLLNDKNFYNYLAPIFTGISVPHLSPEQIRAFRFTLPPIFEQTAIVRFLDHAATKIATAITRARREIDLLHEYRTRLIADVVTGKLDVRKAVARLPDETETSQAMDRPDVALDKDLIASLDSVIESAEPRRTTSAKICLMVRKLWGLYTVLPKAEKCRPVPLAVPCLGGLQPIVELL